MIHKMRATPSSGHRGDLCLPRTPLVQRGIYLLVGGSAKRLLQSLLLGPVISMLGSKKMGLLIVNPKQSDQVRLLELVESGAIKPIIDRRFPLTGVPDALRHVGEGHALGKVVVTMCDATP